MGIAHKKKWSDYPVEVRPIGDDVLRVCCGGSEHRVDRVNVVVIK